MIAVALKGLAGRKVRALLTAFAVVIGVSMVSGTFILTDTMQKTFDGLFAASYEDTDAVIAGKQIVETSTSGAAPVPAGLLAQVRALPEVEAAAGTVAPTEVDSAVILGRDGAAIEAGRALMDKLDVTVLLDGSTEVQPPFRADFPVMRARARTATGFLGAFTTFSTWVVDARLLGARLGGANLAVALVLGLLAVWLGRELGALL